MQDCRCLQDFENRKSHTDETIRGISWGKIPFNLNILIIIFCGAVARDLRRSLFQGNFRYITLYFLK